MTNKPQEQVEREKSKKDLTSKVRDGITTGLDLAAPTFSFSEGFCTSYFFLESNISLTPLFLGVPAGFMLGLKIEDNITTITSCLYTVICYRLYDLGFLIGGYLRK